jgi:hypothetical protein
VLGALGVYLSLHRGAALRMHAVCPLAAAAAAAASLNAPSLDTLL